MFRKKQQQPDPIKVNLLEEFKKFESKSHNLILQEIVKDEIWIVDGFLTEAECKGLIEISEKAGYEDALLTTGVGTGYVNKDIRDSKRVMIDDLGFATYLTERSMPYLPIACEGGTLQNMNERFRFLKYDEPGNKFAMHMDGCYERNDYERTTITIQFYLNEGMKGGATTFFHDSFPDVNHKFFI